MLVPFGMTLSSPDDVEIALMRAQAVILNHPNILHDDFLDKSRPELEEYRTAKAFSDGTLKFSKNVVCVDVYDEGCPDLSFVDLPGKFKVTLCSSLVFPHTRLRLDSER